MLVSEEKVQTLRALMSELQILQLDEDFTSDPNPPAREPEISAFEISIDARLPEDYRDFLSRHDGWPDFEGDAPLLGVSGRNDPGYLKAVASKSELFEEFGDENPISEGAVPLILHTGVDLMLFWYPTGSDAGKYVTFDAVEREEEFVSLAAYFDDQIELLVEMIADEREGIPEDQVD